MSASTVGALNVGSVVTFPGFTGTWGGCSGTTLIINTATAGAIDVGSVVTLNSSGITASKAGFVLTVTQISYGGLCIGMSVSGMTGVITAFGTGTGYLGTYTMSTSQTVASAINRTATGPVTITGTNYTNPALLNGKGGAGQYSINQTFTTGAGAGTCSLSSGAPTRTISAGSGSTGVFTLSQGITAATTTIGGSAIAYTVTATASATTGTFTPAISLATTAVISTGGIWTAPANVSSIKATVIGGSGGGYYACGIGTAGSGGYALGIYSVTPGSAYSSVIGLGGSTDSATGQPGGTSSFGGLLSATGGAGSTGATAADGIGIGGNLLNQLGSYAPQPLGVGNGTSIAAATVWTTSVVGGPGQRSLLGYGGYSGAVLIEYIG